MIWQNPGVRYIRRTSRVKVITLICIAIFLLYINNLWFFQGRPYDTWDWATCAGSSPFRPGCPASRASLASDVQIIVRTGASEPDTRLLSQLKSVLAEVPHKNVLIFSDVEEDIGTYHTYDGFANISKSERSQYPKFELYDAIQTYMEQGKDPGELRGGWELSKYMLLPIKRRIWQLQQERETKMKWFIFIETDTYIDWDNLLTFLEHFDPEKRLYFGSPVWLPDISFAHGGTAYILSYGAMEALNMRYSLDPEAPMRSQFGLNVTELCCGDEALARVLKGAGINLKGYWPMFNGEIPETVHFGPEMWCEPVFSLHHVSGDHLETVSRWIEEWKMKTGGERPFLFKDLFDYILPEITSRREDWDNIEEGWRIYHELKNATPETSFNMCKAACKADKKCFQFLVHGTTCALSYSFRLGRERLVKGPGRYSSGWNIKRIQNWKATNVCESARWLRSNP